MSKSVINTEPVLALDLGAQLGWAVRDAQGEVFSGSVNLNKQLPIDHKITGPAQSNTSAGLKYFSFCSFVNDMRIKYKLSLVYYEQVRRHMGTAAAHCYGGYQAILLSIAYNLNIACIPVPVGTIKKFATGKGNATKAMMIEAMEKKGLSPVDDNEADAYWLLQYAIRNIGTQV